MGNDRYTPLEGTANEKWEQIKNVVIKPAKKYVVSVKVEKVRKRRCAK